MALENLLQNSTFVRILLTIVALAAVYILQRLFARLIRGSADILNEEQRKRLFYSRSLLNLLLAILLLFIWLGQLHNLVLSLTAVTVAVVIATKELLMCLSGVFLRLGSRAFSVGDWVRIGNLRGEVTDHNLLSTTLLEISEAEDGHRYTGRSIVVPNSLFLTTSVKNENFTKNYCVHSFSITLPAGPVPQGAVDWLRETVERRCEPFLEVSRRYNAMIDRKLGVDVPGPEPEVTIRTSDLGNLLFEVVIFCPTKEARNLERLIVSDFLTRFAVAPAAAREQA